MSSYQYAMKYKSMGLNIIPCKGKKPAVKWTDYTQRQSTQQEIDSWFKSGRYTDISIVCGDISNLTILDLDGLEAIKYFYNRFKDIYQSTYTVRTGSGKGLHLYFRGTLFKNYNVRDEVLGGFEIRGNNQLAVAPPSIHKSGNPYQVFRFKDIAPISVLQPAIFWMRKRSQKPIKKEDPRQEDREKGSKYYEAALSNILSEIRRAGKGDRNLTLFKGAARLAQICSQGHLNWSGIESELMNAAMSTSPPMDRGEARKTIQSGYKSGS